MSDKVWYGARLLFECHVAGVRDLYEEKIVLVSSKDGAEDAALRARKLGKEMLTHYQNVEAKDVVWSFKEVLDIAEAPDQTLVEGSEVYSHFLKPEEVEQIRRSFVSGSLG